MSDEKHWVRNLLTVVAAVVTVIVGVLSLLPTLWSVVKRSVLFIIETLGLNLRVPFWTLLLLILLAFPTMLRLGSCFRRRDYCEDIFYQMKWRWRYDMSGTIEDLWCFCPDDEMQLVHEFHGGVFFRCEKCGKCFGPIRESDVSGAIKHVKRLIDRKLRTGEWIKEIVDPKR